MAISYYDFINLSKDSQYGLILAEGEVISETYKNELRFVLYGLSTFTVEIVYSTANNKMTSLTAFQNRGVAGNRTD